MIKLHHAETEFKSVTDHHQFPLSCLQVGAPAGLRAKLDDLTKKYQRYQDAGEISQIGDDPSLDHFMVFMHSTLSFPFLPFLKSFLLS